MRISQIMLSTGFGGAERYFLDLSLALSNAGHEVQVICHHDFIALPLLKTHPNIELHTISVLGKWDPFAPRRLYNLLNTFKPNVVHAHLARGALLTGKATRKTNWPLVVKTHNYVNLKYYSSVDHFITTTQDQFNYLVSHNISEDRISVIPNFSRITPSVLPRPASSNYPTFVTYGRMVHKKGFDLLLEAFAKILSQGINAQLLIGGDGSERTTLERLAKNLGISSQVKFSGWVDDVPKFLSQGDVFVLPSRDEPFGIALIEAMATGIPIIATLTKGPREILSETMGYLVPPCDSEALYLAMEKAISQPEHSAILASNALKEYSTRYYESAVLPQLTDLYQKLQSNLA